ncbi:MAG: TerD family protein [Verrucomicrobia bacterium]|nr:TerD family protein [Verrucomicrobiota bacterium]
MADFINLRKGQKIDLRKNSAGESVYDLSQITVGLGWDVREEKKGFLSGLFGKKEEDFDLDAIAFLLDSNGKVANLGKELRFANGHKVSLHGGDIIFFNSMTYPSGSGTSNMLYPEGASKTVMAQKVKQLLNQGELIVHTGDNLTGEGEGDDEQIIVKLDSLPEKIDKILFIVCIYQGQKKNQHFGQVDNAFIRACDAKGKEIARYSLSNSPQFEGMRSMVFGEIYRHNGDWKFNAVGDPEPTDNFVQILQRYTNN